MKAIAGIIALLVLNAFVASSTPDVSEGGVAYLTGYAVGGPLVIALVVYLAARLFRKAQAPGAGPKVVFWTVGVVFLVNAAGFAVRGAASFQSDRVSDAERSGLEIGRDSIRHRSLGFVLPHPGPKFRPAPELQKQAEAQLANQPSMVSWVLLDEGSAGTVIILVTKGSAVTEASFRGFARGMRKGVMKAGNITVLEDTVEWDGATGEYRLRVQNPAPVYIGMRCLPGTRMIVCVQTGSGSRGDALRFVRTGLAVTH